MLALPGAVGYDPHTRRRTRRALARLRPWGLPVAVVAAALLLSGRPGAEQPADPRPPSVPAAPAGTVLVAVTPGDPAVLGLVVVGSRVDVYAASPSLGPDGEWVGTARLVATDALVLGPGTGGRPAGADGPGPPGVAPGGVGGLGGGLVPGPGPGASALTLAVTDSEAAAIASGHGSGLTLAVRPP